MFVQKMSSASQSNWVQGSNWWLEITTVNNDHSEVVVGRLISFVSDE